MTEYLRGGRAVFPTVWHVLVAVLLAFAAAAAVTVTATHLFWPHNAFLAMVVGVVLGNGFTVVAIRRAERWSVDRKCRRAVSS